MATADIDYSHPMTTPIHRSPGSGWFSRLTKAPLRRRLLIYGGAVLFAGLLSSAVVLRRATEGHVVKNQIGLLLPSLELYESSVIRRDFYDMHFKSGDDASLAFHLLVPKSWIERDIEPPAEPAADGLARPELLAALSPPERDDALLEVSYQPVVSSVSLRQLMDDHAQQLGARILARQPGTFNNRQVEDALLKRHHPQLGPCLSRVTLSRQGDNLFIVTGTARESAYGELRKIFGAAVVSFTNGTPSGGTGTTGGTTGDTSLNPAASG